ncbi:hypothetical protein EK0264_02895 [Epidermidibacterium keratini]|uniref:Uncharacterized protein n=1 Tax=Epidermidibacterium keratini TaxID=1891644 RepID=A0A7L4YVP0_9ACTN|nr:hypothetical protein EK0264_02895 [Epidermidibacterium keratini]
MSARGWSTIVVAILLVAGLWWLSSGAGDPDPDPASGSKVSSSAPSQTGGYDGTQQAKPSQQTQQTEGGGEQTDPVSGLPVIAQADLPPEAIETMALIEQDGPFPYGKDGAVFSNFEGILPDEKSGYYREYTVPTPGEDDRGARRIVTGQDGEMYYTADHYESFSLIEGTR